MLVFMETNIGIVNIGKIIPASPGSVTMACLILRMYSNSGDPVFSSRDGSMPDESKAEEGK